MIEMMLCTIKRERELERQVDQTQRPRYVLRFEPLALHRRLHHHVGFPIHYNVHRGLPPREPSPRRIFYNKGVPNSSLKHRLTTEGWHVAKQQPTPLPKRVYNQTPPLTRGSKPITWSTSTKEGYNKNKGVYNKWFQEPQTLFYFLFSTIQVLID